MPVFVTRVELHDIDEADSRITYDNLHDEMYKEGFRKTVSHKSIRYELPSAEYIITKKVSVNKIKDLVVDVATRIHPKFSIWVTEAKNFAFHELVELKK